MELQKRLGNIQNLKKWDDFRERRDIIVKKYLRANTVFKQATGFKRAVCFENIIRRIYKKFRRIEQETRFKQRALFLVFHASIRYFKLLFKIRYGRNGVDVRN